jgi:hypothetical protein
LGNGTRHGRAERQISCPERKGHTTSDEQQQQQQVAAGAAARPRPYFIFFLKKFMTSITAFISFVKLPMNRRI